MYIDEELRKMEQIMRVNHGSIQFMFGLGEIMTSELKDSIISEASAKSGVSSKDGFAFIDAFCHAATRFYEEMNETYLSRSK